MGGSSGGGDQETTNVPWSGVQGPLTNLYSTTESALQNVQPAYPGQTFPNFTPLQEAGMQGNLDYAQNYYGPASTGYQQQLGQFMDAPLNISQDPAVQAMMTANQDRTQQWLSEQALPQVRGGALNAGQVGGSRQGIAEGQAIGRAADSLTQANAQTMLGAYDSASGLAASSAGMFPSAMQMGFMPGDLAQQYGGAYQQLAGQQLGDLTNQYYYPEQSLWDKMATAGGIYSGAGNYGTMTQPDVGGASPVAGALSGAMMGAQVTPTMPWAGAIGGGILGAMGTQI